MDNKITLIGDIDQNQFQLNSNASDNEQGALQGSNADREISVPNGDQHTQMMRKGGY